MHKFFICILLFSINAKAQNFDERNIIKINVNRNTNYDSYFKTLTNSSAYVSLALPLTEIGIGIINKDKNIRNIGYLLFANQAANYLVITSLKKIIKRPRPYNTIAQIQPYKVLDDYSFPSGHSAGAFNTAGNIAFTYKKWYFTLPAYIWATQVAYSRMHLGVHYPTDILAGALLGTTSAYLCYKLQHKLFKLKQNSN